jgi:hypothetical protein
MASASGDWNTAGCNTHQNNNPHIFAACCFGGGKAAATELPGKSYIDTGCGF